MKQPISLRNSLTRITSFLGMVLLCHGSVPYLAHSSSDSSSAGEKNAEISWVFRGTNSFDIAYSSYNGSVWSEKLVLKTDNPVNFAPSIAKKENNDTVLVWSANSGVEYKLYYALISAENTVKGPTQIVTALQSNTTPVAALAPDGKIHICWAGNNGDDDDIYCGTLQDNSMSEIKRIHQDNNHPDILPQFETGSEGEITLRWNSISENGLKDVSYTMYEPTQTENYVKTKSATPQLSAKEKVDSCIPHVPDEIERLDLATLSINCQDSFESYKNIKNLYEDK